MNKCRSRIKNKKKEANDTPQGKAMEVVEKWFDDGTPDGKMSDVGGSYTGMSKDCEAPEQDAGDL